MTLYAVVDLKNKKILLISDGEKEARYWAKADKEYIVLSTDNISLSSASQAEVSMGYEEECVKESVCTTLREMGIDDDADPAAFDDLAAVIAADAYRSMIKYDTDEDYEIGEAIKAHEEAISVLLAKTKEN